MDIHETGEITLGMIDKVLRQVADATLTVEPLVLPLDVIDQFRDSFRHARPKPFHPSKEFLEVFYTDEGMTTRELAEMCDAGETTVRDWMDQYGIPRRDTRFRKENS